MNLLSKYTIIFTMSGLLLLHLGHGVQGQTCRGTLGDPVVNITFGTGTGFVQLPAAAPGATTTYSFLGGQCPNDGSYSVTSIINSNCFGSSWHNALEDHTPNDANGRMAVFNASFAAGEFYKQTISGLCGNTTYEFGAWAANILKTTACGGSASSIKPNLVFTIESLSGTVLGSLTTGSIGESVSLTWKQYALTFATPAGTTQVVLKISNSAPGGCGNDLILDDITLRPCGPTISVSASAPSICEGSPVALSGSISSGYTNPQFQWQRSIDNGATWSDIAGATSLNTNVATSAAGTLFRLLAAEQGNIGVGYCRIASNPVPLTVLTTPRITVPANAEYCAQTVIDLTDFTATPAATFNWSLDNSGIGLSSTAGTGQIPIFTAANNNSSVTGVFTVTATANGCTSAPQKFSVGVFSRPIANAGLDQTICVGQSATLKATATEGTPTYNFNWNNNLGAGETQTVKPTTTTAYIVTVVDSKGCQSTDDVRITVNSLPVISKITATDAKCNGQANGSLAVTASGATPLQYSLNGGSFSGNNTPSGLSSGTYTVSVKDANGCVASQSAVVNQPGAITVAVEVKNASCFSATDGAVTVNVSGGIAPYTYRWSDGTTNSANIVGRPAGIYVVTVTDANGCTQTGTAIVGEPTQIQLITTNTNVLCNGASTGKIDLTASSKVAIRSYAWSNGATTEDLDNIVAGTYTVTVTDANGCKVSTTVIITQPSVISGNILAKNTTCNGGTDGSVTATGSGGTGSLQYAICSGASCTNFGANQSSGVFGSLAIGTYRVRISDANGCMFFTDNATVSQPAALVATPQNNTPICEGSTLTLSATNAGTGLSYEWTGPNGYNATGQSVSRNKATADMAGTYLLTVRDGNGCFSAAKTEVTINTLPKVDAGKDQVVCVGSSVTLNALASGGAGGYNYAWDNALGAGATKTFTANAAAQYIVTATDKNNCQAIDTVKVSVIEKPNIFTLSTSANTTICAGSDGVPLRLSGSESGVIYELIKNEVNIGQAVVGTGAAIGLGNQFGGTYQIKATTNTNPACTADMTGSVVVNELTPINAEVTATAALVCIGETTTFTITTSGGTGKGYTYTWEDGKTGSPRTFTMTERTIFLVKIADSQGCSTVRQYEVNVVPAIDLKITASPETTICPGDPVSLKANATGASETFKYEWENATTDPSRTVSPNTSTTYIVKATDTVNGCVATKSTTVVVNPSLQIFSVTGGGTFCAGASGLPVGLSGSQTGILYQIKRDGNDVGSAVVGTGTALNFGNQTTPGIYTVEAKSNTMPVCKATMTGNATVATKPRPVVTGNVLPNPVCAGQSVNLSASATTPNAVFTWTGPNGFGAAQQNPTITSASSANAGTYVVVANLDNCRDTARVVLTVRPRPIATITGPYNLCLANTVTLNGNPSGGTGPYTHNWQITSGANLLTFANNNNGTATITPTGSGTASFTYQVTDANGCSSVVTNYTVGINTALPVITVSAGTATFSNTLIGGRYRSFTRPSDLELFTGVTDLGTAANRAQANITWVQGTNNTVFEYDPATDQLKLTVSNSSRSTPYELIYGNVLAQVAARKPGQNLCAMNLMQLNVASTNEPTNTVAFNNVTLNGTALGNFAGAGSNLWTIRNFDFGLGFRLAGNVVLSGTTNLSSETNRVDITVGNDNTPLSYGCLSANEVCEGDRSTVVFSGLRASTTFNVGYEIGISTGLTASFTTDANGNATFQTPNLALAQNGSLLKINNIQRAVTGACQVPVAANNTVNLVVNAKPTVAITVADSSGSVRNDGIICQGGSSILTASGGASYLWSTGETTAAIFVNPANTTTYSVTVTSAKGCQTIANKTITVNPKPVATATNNGPICAEQTLNLSASGGVSYAWQGPNFSAIQPEPTIANATTAASGVYTVTVTDGNGCTQTATTEVLVKEKPVAQISTNSPRCEGQILTLSAADAGAGATYAWSGPAGFSRTNEQNPVIAKSKTTDSGTYQLTVTKNGCANTAKVEVFVRPNPVATALSNSPVCENAPLNFTASNGGAGATYEWTGPAFATVGKVQNPSIAAAKMSDAGRYILTVRQGDCVSYDTINVIVRLLPKVTINPTKPLCAGDSLKLSAVTTPDVDSYNWSGPNKFTSVEKNPFIENATPAASGVYELTVSLSGCTDSARVEVTVSPNPLAEASHSSPICEGQTLVLTAADAGKDATYSWKGPEGYLSDLQNNTITNAIPAQTGVYNLTVTLGNCTSTDTAAVTIYAAPKLRIDGKACADNLKTYTINISAEGGKITTTAGEIGALGGNQFAISGILASVSSVVISVTTNEGCVVSEKITAPDCACPKVAAPVSRGDQVICQGQDIPTLTVEVGGKETVDWYETPEGGKPIAEGTTQFTPSTAGTYYAQTRNLITECLSDSRTVLTLTIKPTPEASIAGITTICADDTLKLSGASSLANSTYNWSKIGGGYNQNGPELTILGAATSVSGVYQLTVEIDGCRDTASVQVNVKPKPQPVAISDSPQCEGATIQLSVNELSGATYRWEGPNNYASEAREPKLPQIKPAQSGTYLVTVTLNGCSTSAVTNVTIYSKPTLTTEPPACATDQTTYSVRVKANNGSITSSTGTVTPLGNDNYTVSGVSLTPTLQNVTIYVTSPEGCRDSVVVKAPNCQCPALEPPVNEYDTSICQKQPVPVLRVKVGLNETADWYDAPTGGNQIATATTQFTPSVSAPGTYTYYAQTRRTDITIRTCTSNTRTAASLTIKPLPQIQLATNSPVCEDDTLQLQTATVANATFAWSGPNGYVSTNQNPIIQLAKPAMSGRYILAVTLDGCISRDTIEATIKPKPRAVATAQSGAVLCANATLQLAADSVANATYAWSGPDNFASNLRTPAILRAQVRNNGTYTLTTTLNGCQNADTVNVLIKPNPEASAANTSPVCEGSNLTLSGREQEGAVYEWKNENGTVVGNTASLELTNATVGQSGVYVLKVSQNGCDATDTTRVLVKPMPVANATGGVLCATQTLQLAADSVAGASYQWSGPVSFGSTLRNPKIENATVSNSGTYELTVTLNGCSKSDTAAVLVKPKPLAQALTNAPICAGDSLKLTAADAGTDASYEWKTPSNTSIFGQNVTIANPQPNQSGKYVLLVTLNGCAQTDTLEVLIKPLPTFTIGSNSPVCEPDTIRLFANDAPVGATFNWSGANEFRSIAQNPVIVNASLNMSGLYQVTVKLDGCFKTDTLTFRVKALPVAQIQSNAPLCVQDTLKLNAVNAGIGAIYEWKGPAGFTATGSNQQIVGVSAAKAGKYILKVTLENCVAYDTLEIGVKQKPVFKLLGNSPVCEADTLRLVASGAPTGTTFVWSGPSQFTSSDSLAVRPNATQTMNGLYQVTATFDGCVFVDTLTATVKPRPLAQATANSPLCEGQRLELLATNAGANALYAWKGPENYVSTNQNPKRTGATTTMSGLYHLTVTLNGCVQKDTVEVLVRTKPTFTIDSVACTASLKTYTIYGKTNGSVAALLPNAAVTQNGEIFQIENATTGINTTLKFNKNGCDTLFEVKFPSCECPKKAPTVAPTSQQICNGDTLRTLRASVEPGITADWYDAADGGRLLAQGTLTYKPTQAGSFYVQARVLVSGCVGNARAVSTAKINPNPEFEILVTKTSCLGETARNDGKLTLLNVKNGERYDYSKDTVYVGGKDYGTASVIPTNGLIASNLANPDSVQNYTVRVFDSTGCFTDHVAKLSFHRCECSPETPTVTPTSQTICITDSVQTLRAVVNAGITADWYDAPTGGNKVATGVLSFKPPKANATYYVEARDETTNCKSGTRAKSSVVINENPSPVFELDFRIVSCVEDLALQDGELRIKTLADGDRFDYSTGDSYTGSATYQIAKAVPIDGLISKKLPNPDTTQPYTVRVFNRCGAFSDRTIIFTRNNCACRPPNCFSLEVKRKTKK